MVSVSTGRAKVVYGGSALHFACEVGNLDMVRLLLGHGADVNAVDHKLERPLHLAVRCKVPLCVNQRMIVQLLCEQGAEVDVTNKKVFINHGIIQTIVIAKLT